MQVTPASQVCTAFSHPEGSDMWTRVPMGVRNGPPHFQRCVNHVLQQRGLYDSVGSFIDDLCNGAADHPTNLEAVEKLLGALAAHTFRLGAGKFEVGAAQLQAFGYLVRDGKLLAEPDRVAAI